MQVPAWTCGEPSIDLRVFVRTVVVDNRMDLEVSRHSSVDLTQEAEEFLMPMTRFASAEHSDRSGLWKWKRLNSQRQVIQESRCAFFTKDECVADACKNGYSKAEGEAADVE